MLERGEKATPRANPQPPSPHPHHTQVASCSKPNSIGHHRLRISNFEGIKPTKLEYDLIFFFIYKL